MSKKQITLSIDAELIAEIDLLIRDGVFASRSNAVERTLRSKLLRPNFARLERECAKLDPEEEKRFAEARVRY